MSKLKINKRDFIRLSMKELHADVRRFNRLPQSMRLTFVLTAMEKSARELSVDGLLSFADITHALRYGASSGALSLHVVETLRGLSVRKLVAFIYDVHKQTALENVVSELNASYAPLAEVIELENYQREERRVA